MTTPNLMLPEVPQAIQNAATAINQGFLSLDAVTQAAVVSRLVESPPGTAVQGDRYIIPPTATGAWADRINHMAFRGPAGWLYFIPRPGWLVYSIEDLAFYYFDGVEWIEWESGGPGGGINHATDIDDFTECWGAPSTATIGEWTANSNVTTGTIAGLSVAGHPGIWRLDTGVSTTGTLRIIQAQDVNTGTGIVLSVNETLQRTLFRIPVLPSNAEQFSANVGFGEQVAVTNNNIRFGATWSGSAPVWRLLSTAASVTSSVDGITTPLANIWYLIEIVATDTLVEAYVNGNLECSLATNIPTVGLAQWARILKAAGTTARQFDIDFFHLQMQIPARY